MVTVNEDKADTNDYCKNVRNEVESCKDPGRRLEDGDDNDGDGQGGHHSDHARAAREEAGGGGARQELELDKLGGVAPVGACKKEE